MAEHMTLVTLRRTLSAQGGVSEKVAGDFLNAFINSIQKGLLKDGQVTINGLGTFKMQDVPARESINVATGERFTIDGYKTVVFTAATAHGKKDEQPSDPIRKLGEQAEEIKDILSELNSMSTEAVVQETTDVLIQAEEQTPESTETPETPQEQPAPEPPQTKPTTPHIKKPFNPWLTGMITIGVFTMLLIIAYFVLRHQIVNWADGMRSTIEQRVSTEPAETAAPVVEVPETTEPDGQAETTEITQAEVSEPVPAAETPKATKTTKSSKSKKSAKKSTAPTPPEELARYYDDNERFFLEFQATETVGQDSRLAWVAKKHYGEKALWVFIYEANRDRVKDPNFVKPGVKLRIPKLPPELRDMNNPETKALLDRLSEKYLQ